MRRGDSARINKWPEKAVEGVAKPKRPRNCVVTLNPTNDGIVSNSSGASLFSLGRAAEEGKGKKEKAAKRRESKRRGKRAAERRRK